MIRRLGFSIGGFLACAVLSCDRSEQQAASTGAPHATASSNGAPGTAPVAWSSDVEGALEAAKAAKRPSIVVFWAVWAIGSVELRRKVLGSADFNSRYGARFALIEVDVTNDSAQDKVRSKRFGVEAVPTLLVFDRHGAEVRRFSELVDLATLAPVLEKATQL